MGGGRRRPTGDDEDGHRRIADDRRHRIEKGQRPNEPRAAPLFQHNLASDGSSRRKPDKIMLNREVRRKPEGAGKRHKEERSHRRKRRHQARETATSSPRGERDSVESGQRNEQSEWSRCQRQRKHTRRTAATDGGRPKGDRRRSADDRRDRFKGRDEGRNDGGGQRGGKRAGAEQNDGMGTDNTPTSAPHRDKTWADPTRDKAETQGHGRRSPTAFAAVRTQADGSRRTGQTPHRTKQRRKATGDGARRLLRP